MSALGWHRVGDGRYRAVTGRRTYIIQRQDFSGIWKVSGNDRSGSRGPVVSAGVVFGLFPALAFTLAPIGIYWRKILDDVRGVES